MSIISKTTRSYSGSELGKSIASDLRKKSKFSKFTILSEKEKQISLSVTNATIAFMEPSIVIELPDKDFSPLTPKSKDSGCSLPDVAINVDAATLPMNQERVSPDAVKLNELGRFSPDAVKANNFIAGVPGKISIDVDTAALSTNQGQISPDAAKIQDVIAKEAGAKRPVAPARPVLSVNERRELAMLARPESEQDTEKFNQEQVRAKMQRKVEPNIEKLRFIPWEVDLKKYPQYKTYEEFLTLPDKDKKKEIVKLLPDPKDQVTIKPKTSWFSRLFS